MTDVSAIAWTSEDHRPQRADPVRGILDRVTVLPVADADQTWRALRAAGATRRPWILAFANAHAVNLCAGDRAARDAFAAADLILRDGIGMAIMMRMTGRDPGANANGTDLIPLLASTPGLRVALYGGRPGVAEAAAENLRGAGANIVAARHGFHPAARYDEWLAQDEPDLVILGMGAPRQEMLARRLRASASRPVGIVCGGAILDFLAGRVRRAPAPMRRMGLEWLHRLALEPVRLGRRYVLGNPAFLARAVRLSAAEAFGRARRRGDRQPPLDAPQGRDRA